MMKPLDEAEKQAIREYYSELNEGILEEEREYCRQNGFPDPQTLDDVKDRIFDIGSVEYALIEAGFVEFALEEFPDSLKIGKSIDQDLNIAVAAIDNGLNEIALARADACFEHFNNADLDALGPDDYFGGKILGLFDVYRVLGHEQKATSILGVFQRGLAANGRGNFCSMLNLVYCAKWGLHKEAGLLIPQLAPFIVGLSFNFSRREILRPYASEEWSWVIWAIAGLTGGNSRVMIGAMEVFIEKGMFSNATESLKFAGDVESDPRENGEWRQFGKHLCITGQVIPFFKAQLKFLQFHMESHGPSAVFALLGSVVVMIDDAIREGIRSLFLAGLNRWRHNGKQLSNEEIGDCLLLAIGLEEWEEAENFKAQYKMDKQFHRRLLKAAIYVRNESLVEELKSAPDFQFAFPELQEVWIQHARRSMGMPNTYVADSVELLENLVKWQSPERWNVAFSTYSLTFRDDEMKKKIVTANIDSPNPSYEFLRRFTNSISFTGYIELFVRLVKLRHLDNFPSFPDPFQIFECMRVRGKWTE